MAKQLNLQQRSVLPDRSFVVAAGQRAASVFALTTLGAVSAFVAGQSISLSQRSQFWLSLVFAAVCLVGMEVIRSVARERHSHLSSGRVTFSRSWANRIRYTPQATLVLVGVLFPFFAAVSVASMRASPSADLFTPTGLFGASLVLAASVVLGLFAVRPKYRRLFYALLPGSVLCYQVVLVDFRAQLAEAEAKFQAIAVEQSVQAAAAYRQASASINSGASSELVAKAVANRLNSFYRDQRIGMGDIGVKVGEDRASLVMHWKRRSVAALLLGSPKEYEIARYLPAVATEVSSDRIRFQSAGGVDGAIQARGVLSSAVGASSIAVGKMFVVQFTNDHELDRPTARLTTLLGRDLGSQVLLVSGTATR